MGWTHDLKTREVICVDEPCCIEVDHGKRVRVTIRRQDGGRALVKLSRKPPAQRGLKRRKP